MRFSARFLFCLIFVLLSSLFITSTSFAQTIPASNSATASQTYNEPNTNPDVPKNLHTWTQNVMIETMAALICQLAGTDPVNPSGQCLGIDPKTNKVGFVENGGGAIGLMTDAITMLYTPPAHVSDYTKTLARNFGVVKTAQAQELGTGFQGLSPLLPIWTVMRDLVYLLFVLLFIIIGFAIMLRIHIDPRTVMTVQNQIPKIIIGLLLVTFSFAIAGFLIDIMYTSIYLAGNALASTDPGISQTVVSDLARSSNTFSAAGKIGGLNEIVSEPASSIGGFMIPIFDNTVGRAIIGTLMGAGGAVGGAFLGGPIGLLIGGVLGGLLGAGIGPQVIQGLTFLIAYLVILIAVIWALFRLWFSLMSAYIFLLLDVVTSPFWIFGGLIPGASMGFGLWIRDLISNLAAFPAAIIMFLLGKIMMDMFSAPNSAFFSPPMVGLVSSQASNLGPLIGLGFILLTPNVVTMTKSALKAPKFDTTPIRQAIGVGSAAPGRIIGGSIGYTFGTHYEEGKGLVAKGGPVGRVVRALGFAH